MGSAFGVSPAVRVYICGQVVWADGAKCTNRSVLAPTLNKAHVLYGIVAIGILSLPYPRPRRLRIISAKSMPMHFTLNLVNMCPHAPASPSNLLLLPHVFIAITSTEGGPRTPRSVEVVSTERCRSAPKRRACGPWLCPEAEGSRQQGALNYGGNAKIRRCVFVSPTFGLHIITKLPSSGLLFIKLDLL